MNMLEKGASLKAHGTFLEGMGLAQFIVWPPCLFNRILATRLASPTTRNSKGLGFRVRHWIFWVQGYGPSTPSG